MTNEREGNHNPEREFHKFSLLVMILVFVLVSVPANAAGDKFVNATRINQTANETESFNSTIGKVKNIVNDLHWNKYVSNTIGFAALVARVSYTGFTGLALMMNAPMNYAEVVGGIGAVLLFGLLIYAVGRGVASLLKTTFKYGVVIALVIIGLSLLFGVAMV